MSINSLIKERIADAPYGSAFVLSDFTDIAEYDTVKKTVTRLEQSKVLRRVMRGVYDKPIFSTLIQEYSAPDPNAVAYAVARNYNWKISASGNTALNQLGLSTQVPANWSYISSGPYKKYKMGNILLEFTHRADNQMNTMSPNTLLLIQALKSLGKGNVGESEITRLKKRFSKEEKEQILKESRHTISWIYSIIKEICI